MYIYCNCIANLWYRLQIMYCTQAFFVYRQCTVLYFLYEQYLYMQQHDTACTMYIPCILHSRNSLYSVYCTLYRYLYFVLLWTISVYSLWDTKVLSCTQSVQCTLYRFWYFLYFVCIYVFKRLLTVSVEWRIFNSYFSKGWLSLCQKQLLSICHKIPFEKTSKKLRPRAKHYQYFIMHTWFY